SQEFLILYNLNMTQILKIIPAFLLVFSLIGCQSDSDTTENIPQQSPQQEQGQQPDQMDALQQQPADIDIDVSDDEIETFADASMEARKIQMEGQENMIDIVEDKGLDIETYQTIAQATQQNKPDTEADISEEDRKKYEEASKELREAQDEIQQEVVKTIEDKGMDMQRFQKISQAAMQDKELQERIEKKFQEKMPDDQQQGTQQQPAN